MQRRRSGFTLLEMLVVIGIIMVLMALAVIGYNVVEHSAAGRQTKTTLADLHAMLAELDAQAGSTALPTYSVTTIGAGTTAQVGDVTSGGSDRYGTVVGWTQNAMATLLTVPANTAALSQLPSKLIMKNSSGNAMSPPVLLDGWGNPIIYVPTGGISVYVTNPANTAAPLLITIKSRDNRPFFASAGPDGNFGAITGSTTAYGDDNVYSIEK